MVGYQAVTSADNKSATEVVTGDWAAYGGNTGRGLYLAKDSTTNKKFLKLKSTGTNSSSFAVNKLDNAPTGQVIITQDVKFYNNNSSILFGIAIRSCLMDSISTGSNVPFTSAKCNANI